jgi:hypothetical protein
MVKVTVPEARFKFRPAVCRYQAQGGLGSEPGIGDMENSLNISGVAQSGAQAPRRQELPAKPAPPRLAPAAPEPRVELAAWFDRNGDGHIDTKTAVEGGDAYLRVGRQVSELLDRDVVRSSDHHHAVANNLAVNAYRKYGSPGGAHPRNS